MDPAATLVLEALPAVDAGVPADWVLDRVLRRHRELDPAVRARVADWTFKAALWRGRIEARYPAARGGMALRLAVTLADQLGMAPSDAAEAVGAGREELRGALAAVGAWPEDPTERLAAEHSLPSWLAATWAVELGLEEATALAEATNRPGPVVLRANAARIDRPELAARLEREGVATKPGRLAPHALVVQGRANLFGCAAWRDGLFEVQDEGSQLVAELCEARPGQNVVDLCAGYGGKTLALGAQMRGVGHIVSVDPGAARLTGLVARARRAQLAIVETRQRTDGADLDDLAQKADIVLVDAPCSELGVLRRHPDLRWRLDPASFDDIEATQRRLLAAASKLVRPGGHLVYATCTIRRAENQAMSGYVEAAWGLAPDRILRLLPHRDGTDGFFAARWTSRPGTR